MKIDLVFLLIIGLIIVYQYCNKNVEKMSNVSNDIKEGIRQVYLADVDAIRNLSEVAKKLQAGGLTNPGNLRVNGEIQTPGGHTIKCDGRQHITGGELLYILNKNGVMIGKEWGGNGNLHVQGDTQVNGSINTNTGIVTNNIIANGWITGSFGSGGKDRVVVGNLDNQAAVGAHNNALNAWTALRLQGDSINMVPNNGIVNFPNGWRINTSDGHFRIQKDGQDKLVAHNAGHPVYAPNGMDVGTWRGTGGGTLNVSGNANINGVASVDNDLKAKNRIILTNSMKMWADGNAFQYNYSDANGNGGGRCRRAHWWNGSNDNCYGPV
jgi:hypothetical protein